MTYLVLLLFLSLVPYLQADPSPDTNVQIQNYDGPIYLSSPKPNICPHCNGLLHTPAVPELERTPCEPTLQTDYPRKAIYGNGDTPIISTNVATTTTRFNPALRSTDHINAGIASTSGFTAGTPGITSIDHGRPGVCNTVTKNTVPFLTNSVTTGNTCNGVTSSGCAGTGVSGNTFPITVSFGGHNGFEGGNGYYGAANPVLSGSDCVTNPFSLFNGQNTGPCYKVPILTCNQGYAEDEPILVPQKFSYSLILDGEVANGNGNQNYPMEYNCVVI